MGINISGNLINNIRYAEYTDDSLPLAESLEDLRTLFSVINRSNNEYGLEMNIKEIKYMMIETGLHQ